MIDYLQVPAIRFFPSDCRTAARAVGNKHESVPVALLCKWLPVVMCVWDEGQNHIGLDNCRQTTPVTTTGSNVRSGSADYLALLYFGGDDADLPHRGPESFSVLGS